MPRAALIDLWGTLMDGHWGRLRRARATLAAEVGGSPELFLKSWVDTRYERDRGRLGPDRAGELAYYLRTAGAENFESRMDDLLAQAAATICELTWPYPDAFAAVDRLRGRGIRCVLVSNCGHDAKPAIEHHQVREHFDAVVLSCDQGVAKPEAEIFQRSLEVAGIDAADAVFIDDQEAYVLAAEQLGIRSVLCTDDKPFSSFRA